MLVEGGGPGDAAQPAQSPRVEWSTIPTAAVGGTTLEALVVGSVEPNEMMGGTGDTGFQVRPCPNPCGASMWPAHEDSLPSDGVIEHRAIIAPRTPPRERRKDKAAQAEQEAEPAQGKGGAPGDARLLKRLCPNPWPTTQCEEHRARLPSDGVIEHRAIIAPRTPPRKRRKDNAEQAEEETEPAHGKGGAPGDTRLLMRP